MLRIKGLNAYYGSVQALKGVSLHVKAGEIVALIGANGAGKTTLLNSISGLNSSIEGEIVFEGKRITGLPTEEIVHKGISQVPEGRQIFPGLSVMDNLLLGAYQRYREGHKKEIQRELETVFSLFPVLKERKRQDAGTLSGGEQQMLAIGRGLMSKPKLLLLDEPSMGLAPKLVKEIFRVIADLRRVGTTILLVEQNARAALKLADRCYVLETGKVILQGTAAELMGNKEVQRAYLGKGYREVWEE